MLIYTEIVHFIIASDLWMSKNSVYAFAGVVAFWIDDEWNLQESVIELLPLSGDHSSKASGKLIFKALQMRGIEMKLSVIFQLALILIKLNIILSVRCQ